jgi:hypothetical protein
MDHGVRGSDPATPDAAGPRQHAEHYVVIHPDPTHPLPRGSLTKGEPTVETLRCVKCKFPTVSLDMSSEHWFRCANCDFCESPESIREMLAAWARVVAWVEQSPFRCTTPAAKAVQS